MSWFWNLSFSLLQELVSWMLKPKSLSSSMFQSTKLFDEYVTSVLGNWIWKTGHARVHCKFCYQFTKGIWSIHLWIGPKCMNYEITRKTNFRYLKNIFIGNFFFFFRYFSVPSIFLLSCLWFQIWQQL